MTKTSLDVTTATLRRIGVAAVDIPAEAEHTAIAKSHLEAMLIELSTKEGFATLTDAEATPDYAFLPLVQMLAAEIGPQFGVDAPRQSWWEGMRRLRRHTFTDDRADPADIDNDGTITAAEAQDDLEAQFF